MRRASPISDSFSDGCGLRHSVSRSCILISCHVCHGSHGVGILRSDCAVVGQVYLNVEFFVDFDSFAKNEDVLHKIGEFPHISELAE